MAISKTDAEAYIKKFLAIQDELFDSGVLDQLSDHTTKAHYQSELISFVFRKDRIDELFQNNNDANALRIYYGAHDNGEPTIVLVPCEVSEDNKSASNITSPVDSADQQPEPTGGRSNYNKSEGIFDLADDPIEE